MADWERRLEQEAQETRDDLERRIMQGDADRNLGVFNIFRGFFAQYMVLLIVLVLVMIIALAIFLFSRVSPAKLQQTYLEQRELIRQEDAAAADQVDQPQ